ncbi:hypothetical protein F4780DRAFT_552001 [Xylariomycetidae sp. FL0641]|nr:hypothetical protein F4780DRAFT_552001 [Xylariomycetidae sp. FL0641]
MAKPKSEDEIVRRWSEGKHQDLSLMHVVAYDAMIRMGNQQTQLRRRSATLPSSASPGRFVRSGALSPTSSLTVATRQGVRNFLRRFSSTDDLSSFFNSPIMTTRLRGHLPHESEYPDLSQIPEHVLRSVSDPDASLRESLERDIPQDRRGGLRLMRSDSFAILPAPITPATPTPAAPRRGRAAAGCPRRQGHKRHQGAVFLAGRSPRAAAQQQQRQAAGGSIGAEDHDDGRITED